MRFERETKDKPSTLQCKETQNQGANDLEMKKLETQELETKELKTQKMKPKKLTKLECET